MELHEPFEVSVIIQKGSTTALIKDAFLDLLYLETSRYGVLHKISR